MTIKAVIFDWSGTITPWHAVDIEILWRRACESHFPEREVNRVATALCSAERQLSEVARRHHKSATLQQVFELAEVDATDSLVSSFFARWEPHTFPDVEAEPMLRALRTQGIRIGILSNTLWPRAAHERVFERDGISSLIDGAVYSSEIDWAKPHPEAFRAAMSAVGVADPAACVFVGDRPYEDIHGAKQAGMRAVLVDGSGMSPFDAAVPDASITRLSELPGHVSNWMSPTG